MSRLARFAGYYDRLLHPENEPERHVTEQLRRLNIMESSTAYPFLLHLYDLKDQGQITADEFFEGLKALETYLVRRFLNRDSTNDMNKMFPALIRDVTGEDFANTLRSELGKRNEPSNGRLRESAEKKAKYRNDKSIRQKLALIFETINLRLSEGSGAYTALTDDPTIEHILPQTMTPDWKAKLGKTWEQDYELLHTLGNLTLVTKDMELYALQSFLRAKARYAERTWTEAE